MPDLPLLLGLPDLTPTTLALLALAALVAGWVDAVVGGGGLVQLPALLLVPGLPAAHALGTNKVSSVMGTAAAAATYRRRVGLPSGAVGTAVVAFVAAVGGASAAMRLPTGVFTPIIVGALVVVLVVTVARPSSFTSSGTRTPASVRSAVVRCALIGAVIGFYDGLLGPGTGSFLLIALVLFLGLETLQAAAMTKTVNLATNCGALLLFSLAGVVQWRLGLVMGAANMCGGWLGAHTAARLGPRFVRGALVVVVIALIIRLVAF